MSVLSRTLRQVLGAINEPRRFRRHLFVVVAIALIVRLGVLVLFWPKWEWNGGVPSDQWNELTMSLVDNHTIGFLSSPSDPSVMRGPIFPLLEAPLYFVFGERYSAWSISLLLIDTLTCFLLMVTARRLWGNRTAILAGLFYAVNLPVVYYTAKIMQVTSILPMVVLWLYLFTLWEKTYFCKWLPWALGVLSGLMILDKTVYLPVPFLSSAVLLWTRRHEIRKAFHLVPVALYLLITLCVVAPWTIRNYIVTKGTIVPVQNLFWEAFVQDVLFYDLDAKIGLDRPDGEVMKYILPKEDAILIASGLSPNPPQVGRAKWEVQREIAFRKACTVWIKEDPVKILKIKVANIWNFWVRTENWRKTRLFILMQVIYLGAAVTGAFILLRYHQLGRLKYGVSLIFVLWAEHCSVYAIGRYSLDLVPILALLFGFGVEIWAKQRQLSEEGQ